MEGLHLDCIEEETGASALVGVLSWDTPHLAQETSISLKGCACLTLRPQRVPGAEALVPQNGARKVEPLAHFQGTHFRPVEHFANTTSCGCKNQHFAKYFAVR